MLENVKKTAKNSCPNISFWLEGRKLIKKTDLGGLIGQKNLCLSDDQKLPLSQNELSKAWGIESLKMKRNPQLETKPRKQIKVADFFCGSGGLSLGIKQALHSVGLEPKYMLACDISKDSLNVYNANFAPEKHILENAENLLRVGKQIDFKNEKIPALEDVQLENEINEYIGNIDIFAAGPPCEGNSNLNNKTRRTDARNNHYVLAALLGAKLGAKIIIIENVQTVQRAKQNVVNVAKTLLSRAGYKVEEHTLTAENYNVAQKRLRHFLIALKTAEVEKNVDYANMAFEPLSTMDAIGDLIGKSSRNVMDTHSKLSEENKERINYLFDNDLYDLPNSERPDCHKYKEHTYYHVYGRMFPDKPAFTITTGFQSPGRGRYIHPVERRGLTPREGARLQGFPDYFRWQTPLSQTTKHSITRLIGDAVPPNLGEAALLIAMASCSNLL